MLARLISRKLAVYSVMKETRKLRRNDYPYVATQSRIEVLNGIYGIAEVRVSNFKLVFVLLLARCDGVWVVTRLLLSRRVQRKNV